MAWSRFIQIFSWFIGMLMVAHLGPDELAASALINATQIMVNVGFMSILFAMGVITARLFGEGRYAEIGRLFQQGVLLSLVMGVFMMAALFYVGDLLHFTGQPQHLVHLVDVYFKAFAWSSLPMMFMVLIQQMFYGVKKQHWVIINNLICMSVYIPLVYLFCYGGLGISPMGIAGLGYAIVAQVTLNLITLLITISQLSDFRKYALFKRQKHHGCHYIRQLFSVGWPMCVQFGGELAAFFVLALFTGWMGVAALGASQVTMQVQLLFLIPLFALSEASGILVSQKIGEKSLGSLQQVSTICILSGIAGVMFFSGFFFFIPDQLTRLYLSANDADSQKIMELSRTLFYWAGLMLLCDTLRNIYSGSLRGFYDTRYSMWVSVFILWLICVPLGYFFGFVIDMGVVGIRIGTIIGFMVGGVLLYNRWRQQLNRALAD